MKRRVGHIGLLLVAGAIVNVAVAWAASASKLGGDSGLAYNRVRATDTDIAWLAAQGLESSSSEVRREFYLHHRSNRAATYTLLDVTSGRRTEFSSPLVPWTFAVSVASGWPQLSMTGAAFDRRALKYPPFIKPRPAGDPPAFAPLDRINVWSVSANAGRVLPLRPIWPGFAINMLFYAVVLWLFVALLALQRRRRIKRGLCPKCAYPIGTSDKCTECGAPLVLSSSVAPRHPNCERLPADRVSANMCAKRCACSTRRKRLCDPGHEPPTRCNPGADLPG